jgi:hypothetical protein
MIGVTEINDDHVKQIGDRIKEILSWQKPSLNSQLLEQG